MDAKTFLAEFGHVANAPEGLVRLRELILRLAVSGDLIREQAPVDAAPLLEEIEIEKQHHPERKKVVGKQPPIAREAVKAPSHWAVCRLGDLTLTITGGGTPSKNNPDYWGGTIPWASVKDLKGPKYLDGTEDNITEEGLRSSASNLIPPGRIIVCTRMGLGKVAINRVSVAINQDLKAFELPQNVNPDFFLLLYRTLDLKGTGTTVSGIRQEQLQILPAALPHLGEQARIVAKVDELMALCDTLESRQKSFKDAHNVVLQAVLSDLATASTQNNLQVGWKRLQDNFEHLFSEPRHVMSLRDLLFDLALRGVLLPESAHDDVDDSTMEGAQLLPRGWKWQTLAKSSDYITSGSRGWKAYEASTGDVFIRSQDLKQDALIFENQAFVDLPEEIEGKRTLVKQGDLLLTITGGNVGKCARVPRLGKDAYVSQHVALIRLRDVGLSEFIHFWMINSFGGRRFLSRFIYGDKPGLNLNQVGSVLIPIPPKDVLPQILGSLRSYQDLCSRFEAQLQEKLDLSAALAVTTVASLTGAATANQKKEPVRAPQTELVASLHLSAPPDVKDSAPLATLLARHNGEMSAHDLWQRFGGDIDAFYAQLKREVAQAWIAEPEIAEVREKSLVTAGG